MVEGFATQPDNRQAECQREVLGADQGQQPEKRADGKPRPGSAPAGARIGRPEERHERSAEQERRQRLGQQQALVLEQRGVEGEDAGADQAGERAAEAASEQIGHRDRPAGQDREQDQGQGQVNAAARPVDAGDEQRQPRRVGAARLHLAADPSGPRVEGAVPVEVLGDPLVGAGIRRRRRGLLDGVADRAGRGRRGPARRGSTAPRGSRGRSSARRDAMRAPRCPSSILPRLCEY